MPKIPINGPLSLSQNIPNVDGRFGPYTSVAEANEYLGPAVNPTDEYDDVISAGMLFGVYEDDGSVTICMWTKDHATVNDFKRISHAQVVQFNGIVTGIVSINQSSGATAKTASDIKYLEQNKKFGYLQGSGYIVNWVNRYIWADSDQNPYQDVLYLNIATNALYYYTGTALVALTAGSQGSLVTSVNGQTGAVTITIPTKLSDLTNDVGFITNAGVTSFNGQTGAVTYTPPVTSVNNKTGAVVLDKTDVGLGNVDNTPDANKQVYSAIHDGSGNPIDETYETKTHATAQHSLLQSNIDSLANVAANLTGLDSTNFGGFSLAVDAATAVSNIPTVFTQNGCTVGQPYWFLAGPDMSALVAYRYIGSGTPAAISATEYDFTDFSRLSEQVKDFKGTITTLSAIDDLHNVADVGVYHVKVSQFSGLLIVEKFNDGLNTTITQQLIASGTPVNQGGSYTIERGQTLARRAYSSGAWTSWTDPIAELQANVAALGPKLYGGVDEDAVSGEITLTNYLRSGSFVGAFQNSETAAWTHNGNARSGYITHADLEAIRVAGYSKLKITIPTNYYGRVTFVKKIPEESLTTQTYQQLVDGGYLSSVHDSYSSVLLAAPGPGVTTLDIPDDAYAVFFAYRVYSDGGSQSETLRKPSSVVASTKVVEGDIKKLEDAIEELQTEHIGANRIADNAVTSQKIADESVTTSKVADGAITADKMADGVIADALANNVQKFIGFNLLNPSTSKVGYIRRTNGEFVSQSSGIYATDFIPVNGKDIKAYNAVTYGTDGGFAVYDASKSYLRGGTSQQYSYTEGDAYVRFTYKTNMTYQFILYGSLNVTGTFTPTYDEQTIKGYSGDIVFDVKNLPAVMPTLSAIGQDGLSKTIASLDGSQDGVDLNRTYVSEWPKYLKNGQTVVMNCNISSMEEVRVGLGRQDTNGFFAHITATRVELCRYTDYVGGYETIEGANHSITISDFLSVVFKMTESAYKIILMSSEGMYNLHNTFPSIKENYGIPVVEAIGNCVLTDISLRGVSDTLKYPIWVLGDSYVSLYATRWTYQLLNTCGVTKFLIDGLAGGKSNGMFAELERLLAVGTPKYLVWCLGMNDNSWTWEYYVKKVEMLCRTKGITLILQTIPWPTGGDKSYMNNYIKDSGYRYIDVYSALSSDAQGTWKTGYNDDGTHTTTLGAKAQAAKVMCDFPEIVQ